MLLSAKRSLLLLPADPPPEPAVRNLELLQTAATQLRVPMVSQNSPNWRVGLATGRNQLVLAGLANGPAIDRLPPGTSVYLVLDCLDQGHQPAETDWHTMAATPVTTEMVVFEWLERGDTEAFRALLELIR